MKLSDLRASVLPFSSPFPVNPFTRSILQLFSLFFLALPLAAQLIPPVPDHVAFVGDTLLPLITSTDSAMSAQTSLGGDKGVLDLAIDRSNRRLYVLTSAGLQVYAIDFSVSPTQLTKITTISLPTPGTHLALSLDARTAYIGSLGKVTAINLYPESAYVNGVAGLQPAYLYIRTFPLPKDRPIAAMAVHPAGDRLFVVIDMDPAQKKININNDLLRSDVGNGVSADQIATLPDDFGFITQLDISADTQTSGKPRAAAEFATPLNIKSLIYTDAKRIAIGIKGLTFSPDGNCAFLAAVGAQSVRATAFGIMPTSDEGTGGIVVLDVRPLADETQPFARYLQFIPTTEKGENTAELRHQIQREGWRIVHPVVQYARNQYSLGQGELSVSTMSTFTAPVGMLSFTLASIVLDEMERSYRDYGYMQAYYLMYPHDMVGASSVAISHRGDFGVVTMQDTNNLGLLSLTPSHAVSGYAPGDLPGNPPPFFIAIGTGKTVNGFDAALPFGGATGKSSYSWAYPQKVAFTSDDSRIYLGMAGGVPTADGSNKFGSANALNLRAYRDLPDSPAKRGNLAPGYDLFGNSGSHKSPRLVGALNAFDSDNDKLSDQTEALNRWNDVRMIPAGDKGAMISTTADQLTDPGTALLPSAFKDDALDKSIFLPESGLGYRFNRQELAAFSLNAGSRSAIAAIEKIGRIWHDAYLAGNQGVSRPYFVVGAISQPGGGPVKTPAGELQYGSRNGFQVNFPYMALSGVGPVDDPHDFVLSNAPPSLRDNSLQHFGGFDKANMAKFITLLVAEPSVSKIELDPGVPFLLKQSGINFADAKFEIHGALNRPAADGSGSHEIDSGTRRDVDAEMCVSFSPLAVSVTPAPPPAAAPAAPGRIYYTIALPPLLNRATMKITFPKLDAQSGPGYVVRMDDGTVVELGKEYNISDFTVSSDGKIVVEVDILDGADMASGIGSLNVEILSPELDNVYSLHTAPACIAWTPDKTLTSHEGEFRRRLETCGSAELPNDKKRTTVHAEITGIVSAVTYSISSWVPLPDSLSTEEASLPVIDSATGEIKAGKDAGTLYVEARAAANPLLRTRPLAIDVGGCGTCSSGTCSAAGNIDLKLGSMQFWVNDGANGQLRVRQNTPVPNLASPALLEYPFYDKDTTVVLDASGAIRQVLTSQVLMDVVGGDSGYVINTYRCGTAKPEFNSKLAVYSLGNLGSAISSLAVAPDATAGATGVLLTRTQFGAPADSFAFRYADHAWTLVEQIDLATGAALREQSVATSSGTFDGQSVELVTHTTKGSAGEVAEKRVEVFATLSSGRRVVAVIEDPDGANRVTSYKYNAQGLVSSVAYPDGRWSRHEYDSSKREIQRVEPWLGSAFDAPASACKVTTFDYTPLDSTGGNPPLPDAPRTTIVTVQGQEIACAWNQYTADTEQSIVATRVGAAWNDATNRVTTTRRVAAGAFAGRVATEESPDGTVALYDYSYKDGGEVTVERRGAPNAGRTTIVNGTATTTIQNAQGQVIESSTTDIASGLTLDLRKATEFDASGRPTRWLYAVDGSTSSTQYGCCGVDSETDRQGITTTYEYDALKRVKAAHRLGLTNRYEYDAVGRVLQTTRVGSDNTAIVVSRSVYHDRVGDVIDTYDAVDRLTHTETVHNADGTTNRTTTLPGGFTQWTKTARDGHPIEAGGSAAAPMRYEYRVALLDAVPCSVTRVIALVLDSATGQYRDTEWTETWTDMAGQAIRQQTADGAHSDNSYNAKGQLVRSVDADGVATLFAYNERGERSVTAIDLNRNDTIDYTGSDRITRTATVYTTKSWNNQLFPVARTTTELWSDASADTPLLVSMQEQSLDGLHTWITQFDQTSHQEMRYPGNRDASWTTVSTGADGTATVQTYASGRLTSTSQLSAVNAPVNAPTRYRYDSHGRLTETRTYNDLTVAASDSAFSLPASAAGVLATVTTYTKDDQVATVTAPDPEITGQSIVTTNSYNARSLLESRTTSVVPATGAPSNLTTTSYTYTPQGQLDRVSGSQTYPIDYDYDSQGRMVTMTTWKDFAGDTGKATTTWQFDPVRGSLVSKRDHTNAGPTYTYTPAGRLLTRTWARQAAGQPLVTSYAYYPDGTLAALDYSDATPDLTYSYHRHGRVKEVRDGVLVSGAISDANLRYRHTFSFNATLRAGTETIQTSGEYQLTRTYETAGASTVAGRYSGYSLKVNGAAAPIQSVAYAFDVAGRLGTVTDTSAAIPRTFTYAYRPDASLLDTVTGPVHTVKLDYQPKGYGVTARTNQAGASVISRFGYTTNALGQRTAAVNTGAAFPQASHFAYQYNDKGEVTQGRRFQGSDPAHPGAPIPDETFAYAFDDIGNRKTATTLAATGQPGVTSVSYTSNLLNQYTSIAAQVTNSPVHDADGNLTDDGRWQYTWNAENRLVAMETASLAVTAGVPRQRLEFTYDYQGRRVTKKVYNWDSTASAFNLQRSTAFLYDGWNLAAEYLAVGNSSSSLSRSYTWGLDLSGSPQGAGGTGGLLAISEIAKSWYPVYDANGNISEYLSQTGVIAAHFEYGPFGEVIRAQILDASISNLPFGFSTKYTDSETSLCYYGFRYYGPSVGRWLSRDPIEEQGGENTYVLVYNDPDNNIDKLGLVLAAFDGTGNDDTEEYSWASRKKGTFSNVVIMRDLYDGVVFYRNGVGTRTDKFLGNLFGKGLRERVADILDGVVCYLKTHPNEPVDVIGFSRGAASARIFVNDLKKRVPSASIRFLGIFDTVAQIGPPNRFNYQYGYDQDVHTDVIGYTAHAVSADEHRSLFPLTSISKDYPSYLGGAYKYANNEVKEIIGDNFWEKPFPGVHSDIGGGYKKGGRNIDALLWMIERGQSAGAPFMDLENYEFFQQLMDANENYKGHKSNYPILDRIPFTQIGRHKRKIFPGTN
jgi:RHS repeat-associated protein